MVTSTKPYAPWINKLMIIKSNRSEAIILEKKLKNLNRQRLLAFIEKYKDDELIKGINFNSVETIYQVVDLVFEE